MNIIFKIDTWQEIYHSLKNNKLRTFLTMIGVGWGMFLFVSLLGAAKGMENGFTNYFLDLQPILFLCGHRILLFRIMVSQKADN